MRIELACDAGRISEAAELVATAPELVEPRLAAEVALALGDLADAERRLAEVTSRAQPHEQALLGAMRAEAALARGDVALARTAVGLDGPPRRRRGGSRAVPAGARGGRGVHRRDRGGARHPRSGRGAGAGRRRPGAGPARAHRGRRAGCLVREGRLGEATTVLESAERGARALDDVRVADELRLTRARLWVRRGDLVAALELLRELVAARRARGDELGALVGELELADALLVRGDVVAAAELAGAAATSAGRRGLQHLAARARLALATVLVLEARHEAAEVALAELAAAGGLDAVGDARAEVQRAEVEAANTRDRATIARARAAGDAEIRDELDRALAAATVAVAAGEFAGGLTTARDVAGHAERAGRRAELATALALIARLELARGDHGSARAAATRAVREATAAGLVRARTHALLALAALARDEGQAETAVAYARDAADLATQAGLPVERLTASAALDGLVGADVLADPTSPSAATMAPSAVGAAARLLADLGLTAQRPFRVIDADGQSSDVADASPEILRMTTRSLAVDGVRESLWRRGEELADLRRRSLLKRLLFLFAAAPGKIFSKEEIVRSVWNVDYHPLRHDAALFTNIMRIRRLLGEDGAEIIRVSDDGYRFVPPRDYVFVQPR
ncbi:MAG: helix-turn-helix domain-containing protein [Kofleriaceae bacterium]